MVQRICFAKHIPSLDLKIYPEFRLIRIMKDPIKFGNWCPFEKYLASEGSCFKFNLKSEYHPVHDFNDPGALTLIG